MTVTEIIGEEYKQWKNGDIIRLNAPTGSGKTRFILDVLLKYVIEKGGEILYCVNRKALKKQIEEDIEICASNLLYATKNEMKAISDFIYVCTYQQIENQICGDINAKKDLFKKCNHFSVVVYDECHYFYADSTFNTNTELSYDFLRNYFVDKIQIFMSATIKNVKSFINDRVYLPKATNYQVLGYGNGYGFTSQISKNEPKDYKIDKDYSYIELHIFNKQDDIVDIIEKKKEEGKWLIFVDSKKMGMEIREKLLQEKNNKEKVGYIDTDYIYDDEEKKIINELTKERLTKKEVLITTPVIDNGISIIDKDLRNIVIFADNEESFIQMLGRKRLDEGKTKLFICRRNQEFFKKRLREVEKIKKFYNRCSKYLNENFWRLEGSHYVYPLWDNMYKKLYNDMIDTPIYMEEDNFKNKKMDNQQKVLHEMISYESSNKSARKLIYSLNGFLANNSFAVKKINDLDCYYREIVEKIKEDPDYFVKKQAEWLDIPEDEVEKIIINSNKSDKDSIKDEFKKVLTKYLEEKYVEKLNTELEEKKKQKIVSEEKDMQKKDLLAHGYFEKEGNIQMTIELIENCRDLLQIINFDIEKWDTIKDSLLRSDRGIKEDYFNILMKLFELDKEFEMTIKKIGNKKFYKISKPECKK